MLHFTGYYIFHSSLKHSPNKPLKPETSWAQKLESRHIRHQQLLAPTLLTGWKSKGDISQWKLKGSMVQPMENQWKFNGKSMENPMEIHPMNQQSALPNSLDFHDRISLKNPAHLSSSDGLSSSQDQEIPKKLLLHLTLQRVHGVWHPARLHPRAYCTA